jgi:cyclophilin family peptidyl-prolyl cis-trans isomerase
LWYGRLGCPEAGGTPAPQVVLGQVPWFHTCSQQGGEAVSQTWKLLFASWMVLFLLGLAGCGKGGDAAPAAVANSAGEKTDKADALADPSGSPKTPKPEQDPAHPVVTFDTTLGKFTVRLDADKARLTVDNFLGYVNRHHYDQTIFHLVQDQYPKVVSGGAYGPDLKEKKAGAPIYNEARTGGKNTRGTIGMIHQADAIHSATCHFYINLSDNPALDHKDDSVENYGYCVFGQVVDGMDVVERIGQVQVHDTEKFQRMPKETVAIRSVQRIK